MKKTIRAEYVCNAGVLLHLPDHVIGVDVFASCENGFYKNTSLQQKEIIFRLIKEDRLKLLVFTHHHCDHYNRADVLEALRTADENHSSLTILTTGQTAEDLIRGGAVPERVMICDDASCYNSLGQMLPEAAFRTGSVSEEADEQGLKIRGFYTRHDGHQYASVQNIVLLMSCPGRTIVFTGDAAPDAFLFERIGQWSRQIDWMFVPFPLTGLMSARRKMAKELNVDQIAAFHLPWPEQDSQGWYENTCKVCAQAKDALPQPVFLTEPGTEVFLTF